MDVPLPGHSPDALAASGISGWKIDWSREHTGSTPPNPTKVGGFFTKPMQGNLFRIFRRRGIVLGHQHTDTLKAVIAEELLEERVGSIQSDPIATISISRNSTERSTDDKRYQMHITWAEVLVKGKWHIVNVVEMNEGEQIKSKPNY